MSQKQITAALIGTGRIGKMHAENIISSVPGVCLKTVVDLDLDYKWAEKCGIKVKSNDINQILNDPEIDAVVIATPSASHVDMIKTVAESGKQIFCEKPIAFDPVKISKTIEIVNSAGVKLQVGFNRRFDPDFSRVKEAVKAGEVGDIHIIKITNRDPVRPDLNFIPDSGGLFMDFSVHDFDTMRYLSGSEAEEIYAAGAVLIDPEMKKLNDIDTALITVKLTNGGLCIIDNSRETNYGYDQQIEVFGNKGSISAKNTTPTNTVLCSQNGVFRDKPHFSFVERYQQAFILEMSEFFRWVREEGEPPVSGTDALAAVNMARSAQLSLQKNKPVRVEL